MCGWLLLQNAVKNSSLKSSRPGSKLDHPASSPTSDREKVKDGRSKKKLRKVSERESVFKYVCMMCMCAHVYDEICVYACACE